MDGIDELKQIDIRNHTCYYFDGIINIGDFNLDNILIDEKSYQNILVYNISYKTLIDAKPLRIRFAKIDGFIQSRFESPLLGLHVFFVFFSNLIFDKFTAAISCE